MGAERVAVAGERPDPNLWTAFSGPREIKAFTGVLARAYKSRMRSFFVEPDEIHKAVAVVVGSEARHIRKVLRLCPGARVRVTDGRGHTADACIQAVEADRVLVEILAPSPTAAADARELVVAQAMLKDRKMDALIRALTELGVTTWLPFISVRSVAQPDPRRLQTRLARWARISREAVKQCGRRRQPHIRMAAGLRDILERSADIEHKIMFWEEAAALPAASQSHGKGRIMVIIGPEGGFTAEEAQTARQAGFALCALGPRILRAETAALAAVTLVQYLFGDWSLRPPSLRLK